MIVAVMPVSCSLDEMPAESLVASEQGSSDGCSYVWMQWETLHCAFHTSLNRGIGTSPLLNRSLKLDNHWSRRVESTHFCAIWPQEFSVDATAPSKKESIRSQKRSCALNYRYVFRCKVSYDSY